MRLSSSANQPRVAAVVDRRDRRFVSQFSQIKVMMMMTMMMMRLTDRRTDGRTPDRYIDPRTAYCAGSVSCACDYVFYILCAQFVFSLLNLGLHVLLGRLSITDIYTVKLVSDGYTYCLQCFDTVGWVAGRASGL